MYDLSRNQTFEIVEELLRDFSGIDTPFDYTDFDQDLLTSLNRECGNYHLDMLTGSEILMWLRGIRDGLNF